MKLRHWRQLALYVLLGLACEVLYAIGVCVYLERSECVPRLSREAYASQLLDQSKRP